MYVEIKLLRKHGWSLRQIAEETGCAVNTVRRALEAPTLPAYDRRVRRETKLGPHEAYLRARQQAALSTTATEGDSDFKTVTSPLLTLLPAGSSL